MRHDEESIDRISDAVARVFFAIAALICWVASNYMPLVPQVFTILLGFWCIFVCFFAKSQKQREKTKETRWL